jgi:hypothetical protein
MVEGFLMANPDLNAELEVLRSTQLPSEAFSFDKESLMATSMMAKETEEDLLLYIDDELPFDKKQTLEIELNRNTVVSDLHQTLLKTKLDSSEIISYPNKKVLYRRTEKVFVLKTWMRVAAMLIFVAATGVFYIYNNSNINYVPATAKHQNDLPNTDEGNSNIQPEVPSSNDIASTPAKGNENTDIADFTTANVDRKETQREILVEKADVPVQEIIVSRPLQQPTKALSYNAIPEVSTTSIASTDIINTSPVTSALLERTTIETAQQTVPKDAVAANNEHKGSIKSFLRKATRLIERKTGIDPTNGDDDELLIGVVAVKLK